MGIADRIIRVLIAVVFVVLILSGTVSGVLALVLGIIGGIFLLNAASGVCLLYLPFNISTRSPDHHHSAH